MASSSQVASASPPPPSDACWKFDVFLSFRGADTRKGITVDLHDALNRRGIRTFMDDPDLKVGDAISRTLIEAIQGSRFAVVILSQNYAFSTWCLEELEEICQSMEDSRILPLFYHVEPSDVRYQKQSFGEAFTKHETSGRYESEKVKKWRAALNKVANISGWNTNYHKTHKELVHNIVEFLQGKLVPEAIESAGDFQEFEATGQAMDEILKAFKEDDVTAIGVYGMGGVGKTTLVVHVGAKVRNCGIFDCVTMVVVSQNPDFEKLQDTLAEELGFELHEKTEIGRAARLRKEIMRREKILIVLDDIWEGIELSRIGIPSYKELRKCKSKVLLTTRIRNVCHVMECQEKITLNTLSKEDAWALFVIKARRSFESPTFESVAKKIAGECGGLPIALVTVARALGDKELVEWERAAQQLEKSQPANPDDYGEASKCIRLSYDYLKDEEYKSYFLLCCLFPEDYDIPVEVLFRYAIGKGLFQDAETLKEARERADSVARHLKYSSLLLDDRNNEFVRMHDVVRDAAIQIAQSTYGFLVKPGCRLEEWPLKLHEGYSAISLMRNYICKLPDRLVCPKLQILLLNKNFFLEDLLETVFQSPYELRVLDLSFTSLSLLPHSFSLLTNLQALHLDDWTSGIIDASILGKLKNLEILSMRNSCLKELPIEIGGLTNLRLLDVTCPKIARIPSKVISKLHNLEELYVQGFREWGGKVEGEKEETNALEKLYMRFRKKSNARFGEVTSLSKIRVLRVSISDAECLPRYVEFIPKWIEFDIRVGRICEPCDPCEMKLDRVSSFAHKSSGRVNSILLELDFINRLPEWFCNEIMKLAERLRWAGCRQRLIDIFVESEHGRLQGLKQLNIQRGFEIDEQMKAKRLQERERLYTERLQEFEDRKLLKIVHQRLHEQEYEHVFGRMNKLNTMVWFPKKTVFKNLEELVLSRLDCADLCAVELAPGSLINLKVLDMQCCYNWGNILLPSTLLQKLLNLEILDCSYMKKIEYVFGCEALLVSKQLKLRKIRLYDLTTVSLCDGPSPPAMFQNLQSLSIEDCNLQGNLFTYDVAQCLSQLNHFDLRCCIFLERIVEASNQKTILPKLKHLSLIDLPMLYYESATFDIECPSLEELFIGWCNQLQGSLFTYNVAECLSHLNHFELWGCPLLERIVEASNKKCILPKLKKLSLIVLPVLYYESSTFIDIECPSLEELSVLRCVQLQGSLFTYDVAQGLSQLNRLELRECPLLEKIVETSNKKSILQKLKKLILTELPMLYYESVTFDIECPSLEHLYVEECPNFSASRSDFHSRK